MTTSRLALPSTPQDWQLYSSGGRNVPRFYTKSATKAADALAFALSRFLLMPIGSTDAQLATAWQAFRAVQLRYRKQGADDSEPTAVALLYLDNILGKDRVNRVIS